MLIVYTCQYIFVPVPVSSGFRWARLRINQAKRLRGEQTLRIVRTLDSGTTTIRLLVILGIVACIAALKLMA